MFLGIDIGTSGCKILLVNPEGDIVSEASGEYNLITPRKGWIEQDPEEIHEAIVIAMRQLAKNLERTGHRIDDISAIAIDSPRDSMIPVDSRGKELMNCITWMDQRALKQVRKLQEDISESEVRDISGHGIETAFWVPKILWIQENRPEVFKRAVYYLNPGTYILSKLVDRRVIHISAASRTMLIDLDRLSWSKKLSELAGITVDNLSSTSTSLDIVGETSKDAEEFGLKSGIPVTLALSDDHCTAVGIGAINIGSLGVTAATNDAFYLPVEKPLELEDETKGVGCTPHLIPGKYIQHFSISSTSGSLRWFRDNFAYEEMEKGEETDTSAYVYMDELATNVPLGSEGLFFYPYLWGADVPIFNEDACGMFFGIKLGHSKGHFIRAILEGVAFQYIGAFDFLRKFDVDVNTVSMAGGASTSNLWNQLKADAINMPIQIPSSTDAAPFGAALAAGVAVGEFKSLENAASRLIKWESTFEPSKERHEKMRKLYKKYMEIYDVVSPHMRASTENKSL